MKHREMVTTALGLIELNQEVVRELLDYFPETGELIWKVRIDRSKFVGARSSDR